MKSIEIQKVEVRDNRGVAIIEVTENGKALFGKEVPFRTETELHNTLRNLRDERTQVEGEVAKVQVGVWEEPVQPTPAPAPAPTLEEIKAQEISAKEIELQQAVEEAKKNREIAELALIDPNVAEKLSALKTAQAVNLEV